MAEPEKDQIGDGQDNFGQAAGKAIQAANSEYGKCLKDDPVRHFGKRHVRSPHRC